MKEKWVDQFPDPGEPPKYPGEKAPEDPGWEVAPQSSKARFDFADTVMAYYKELDVFKKWQAAKRKFIVADALDLFPALRERSPVEAVVWVVGVNYLNGNIDGVLGMFGL